MHLPRHQVGETVEPERGFVRDNRLRPVFPVAAPQAQTHEVFVISFRVSAQPEQAVPHRDPMSPLPMVMLQPVILTGFARLLGRKVPGLPVSDLEQSFGPKLLRSLLYRCVTHAKTLQ